ncbi:hypothetical protein V8F20_006240 [Naviculisporaceae sp. PSN 640]
MVPELSNLPPVLRNLTWEDFDPSKNCTLAGKLLGQWAGSPDSTDARTNPYIMAEFVKASSPIPINNTTHGQIIDWDMYNTVIRNVTLDALMEPTKKLCFREFCQNLDWEGDQDLAGIGVLVVYIIQVSLTLVFSTLYTVQLSVNWRRTRAQQPPITLFKRADLCFDIFFLSSFYFGLCFAIASIIITVASGNTRYNSELTMTTSQLSSVIILTMGPKSIMRTRHPTLARSAGIMLLVLLLVTFGLQTTSDWADTFESTCLKLVMKRSRIRVFRWVSVSLMTMPAPCYVVWLCLRRLGLPHEVNGIAFTWLPFIAAVMCLMCFVELRVAMGDLVGDTYSENQWSIGQILAVTAWIPTFVQFVKIWTGEYIQVVIIPKLKSLVRWKKTLDADTSAENSTGNGSTQEDMELQAQNQIEVPTLGTAESNTALRRRRSW